MAEEANWLGVEKYSSYQRGISQLSSLPQNFSGNFKTGELTLTGYHNIALAKAAKTLDKTSNTKYAAQLIAEHIQSWLPTGCADPESHQVITNLQQGIAQLKQRLGNEPVDTLLAPHNAASPGTTPPPPPAFDPAPTFHSRSRKHMAGCKYAHFPVKLQGSGPSTAYACKGFFERFQVLPHKVTVAWAPSIDVLLA